MFEATSSRRDRASCSCDDAARQTRYYQQSRGISGCRENLVEDGMRGAKHVEMFLEAARFHLPGRRVCRWFIIHRVG